MSAENFRLFCKANGKLNDKGKRARKALLESLAGENYILTSEGAITGLFVKTCKGRGTFYPAICNEAKPRRKTGELMALLRWEASAGVPCYMPEDKAYAQHLIRMYDSHIV